MNSIRDSLWNVFCLPNAYILIESYSIFFLSFVNGRRSQAGGKSSLKLRPNGFCSTCPRPTKVRHFPKSGIWGTLHFRASSITQNMFGHFKTSILSVFRGGFCFYTDPTINDSFIQCSIHLKKKDFSCIFCVKYVLWLLFSTYLIRSKCSWFFSLSFFLINKWFPNHMK